jgi:hypothetical protein
MATGALAVQPPFLVLTCYGSLLAMRLAIGWNLQLVYSIAQVLFPVITPSAVKLGPADL